MKPIVVKREQLYINRYVHLLAIILIGFLTMPLFVQKDHPVGIPLLAALMLAAILLALRAVTKSRGLFMAYCGLVAIGFALDLVAVMAFAKGSIGHMALTATVRVMYAGFLLVATTGMLRRLFESRSITVDTILGGICLYFLLGFIWSNLYVFLQLVQPGAFGDVSRIQLFFFSFTTLTTLGYGDVTPDTPYAMVLANLQAIAGQMYVAVFIARLVGLHIVSETVAGESASGGDVRP